VKELIRSLIPPLVWKWYQRSCASKTIYPSYEAARARCSPNSYEEDDVIKVVISKNIAYRKAIAYAPSFDLGSLRTLIGLGIANQGGLLRVLDFGGGGGYHYALAKQLMAKNDLRWNIVETKAMAAEGARIATDALKFFDNIDAARADLKNVDITFTSGALQYCSSPLRYLSDLIDVGAKYLYITRTALNNGRSDIVIVQESNLSDNGPGALPEGFTDRKVSYPVTFSSQSEFERLKNKIRDSLYYY